MKRKFLYSEAKLSTLTGISRTDIIKLRKEMPKGKYWRKSKHGKGGAIELSQEAVDIILKTFGLTDTDPAPARIDFGSKAKRTVDAKQSELNDAQREKGGDVNATRNNPESIKAAPTSDPNSAANLKLLTVSALPPNKRIVKAVNGTGEVYDVIVPDNRAWAIGNRLRAKDHERHIGFLELVGPAPRRRGDRLYEYEFV